MPEKCVIGPVELVSALKRYLAESGETEKALASQIGINHHTPQSLAIRREESTKGKAGANRVLSKARRILVSFWTHGSNGALVSSLHSLECVLAGADLFSILK